MPISSASSGSLDSRKGAALTCARIGTAGSGRRIEMALKVGDKAPAFSLKTDGGGKVSLSGLKGQNVVLYFYPKDDTPGCTTEACSFRDNLPKFGKMDAVIIGVSRDTAESHDKFKTKHKLNFALGA